MKRDTPLPLYAPVHSLDPSIPLFTTYLLDGLFLNQKTNKNIRISYLLKYKHSKKKFFTKKQMVVQDEINIPGSSINQLPNSTMSVILCTGATFVKKNSFLVATIISFYTLGLHLLTFLILEPLSSKYILTWYYYSSN